jgi:hypothetical protein
MLFFNFKRSARLSRRAIDKNPWNAVYLPLGRKPGARLVSEAHFIAQYCYGDARRKAENPEWRGIRVFEPGAVECGRSGSPKEHADAALHRIEELEAMDPALTRLSGL